MAKAKKSVNDTGMYVGTTWTSMDGDEESMREIAAQICSKMATYPKTLEEWLDSYHAFGVGVLKSDLAFVKHPNGGWDETPIAKDTHSMLMELKIVRWEIEKGNLKPAVFHALQVGRFAERMAVRPCETMVMHERNRKSRHKKTLSESHAVTTHKKARARAMFQEWYLGVPKTDRPNKNVVERDIANRLNIEFPHSPTSPRRVRDYLKSENSENL